MTDSTLQRFDEMSSRWDIANSVRPLITDFFRDELTTAIEKLKNLREVHTHHSIPNLTDMVGEGCMTCDRNAGIEAAITTLKEHIGI